jgi:hypothetical protein
LIAAAAPPDEEVIWSFPVTKGFFKKTVALDRQITSYRVIQGSGYIGLQLLDDIVVMNQHRVSDSSYTSVGGGRYSPRIGTGRSTSRTVGDVAFIHEGKPFFIFYQIPDPQGVARLAKAARKRRLENIKTAEKMNKARLQEQRLQQQEEKIGTRTTAINNDKVITCPRCSSTNTERSKYCSNCGFRFADAAEEEEETIIKNQRPLPSSSPSSSLIKKIEQNNIIIGKFVTCELPAYGVRISYPSNWAKIEQGLKGKTFVMFKSPKEDPSDIISDSVGIALFDIPKVELDQFMNGVMNNLKMKNPDLSVIESTPTKLAGKDAHKVVYYLRGKKHMTIITRKENKAYQVMYVAEPAKYDTYLPIVQKMIDSFEITANK